MAEATDNAQQRGEQALVTQSADAGSSNEFERLLQKAFKPKSEKAKEAVENAVRTLAEQGPRSRRVMSLCAPSTDEKPWFQDVFA